MSNTHPPLPPSALRYDSGPSVVVCSDQERMRDRIATMANALGARVASTMPIVGAVGRIAEMPAPDLIALDVSFDSGDALDRLLDRINLAALKGHHAGVIHCTPELIDVVTARAPDVPVMSGASAAEYSAALALALSRPRAVTLREGDDETVLQLRQLSEEVSRIARALAQLSQGDRAAETPFGPTPATRSIEAGLPLPSIAAVRTLIRARRLRDHYFAADLFADPAWDMLLDLLLARLEGRPVAVSSLCIAAAVPPTTALRWIKRLTDEGLFVRAADPRDGRRVFIDLSEDTAHALIAYVRALGKLGVTLG